MARAGMALELGHCVLTEFDEDGFLMAQRRGLGDDPRIASNEVHHSYGFISRPADSEFDAHGEVIQGKACTLLVAHDGHMTHSWLCGDPRPIALLPVIGKGESMQYGPAANFARCKADGTVTMSTTTDGTFDGLGVYCEVAPDGITMLTPWGRMTLKAEGFSVETASGARIDMGAIAGLPAPFDQLGSYLTLSAALIQFEASSLSLGSTAGLADAAAKATPTLAVLTAQQTATAALLAYVQAIATAVTAGAGFPPVDAAAIAAVTAAATALSAAAATLPAASTMVT